MSLLALFTVLEELMPMKFRSQVSMGIGNPKLICSLLSGFFSFWLFGLFLAIDKGPPYHINIFIVFYGYVAVAWHVCLAATDI